jgi:predicted permease
MIFLKVILPVFLIIGTGYFFEKLKKPDFKSISDLTLYFFTPCLIFEGLLKSKEQIGEFVLPAIIFMIILTFLLYLLSIIFSRFLKLDFQETGAFSLATVMMNCGNFGLPLILFAFGEKGLAYAVVVLVIFTFPLGTLAVFIASRGKSSIKKSLLEITKIPLFYSILLAVIFKYFNLSLPSLLMKPIILMGEAAIPALLVLLGMQLARTDLKTNLNPILGSCFIRLVISPVLAFFLCKVLSLSGLPAKVLIIQTSTPSAIIPLLYSINYDTRPDIVAGTIFFSTILSAGTLTILMYMLGVSVV